VPAALEVLLPIVIGHGYRFAPGEKPLMLTLFAVAAFVISVLFAMGEVAYKRSFPKVTGAIVALFAVLLVGSVFVH
jgi:hypothetical protein